MTKYNADNERIKRKYFAYLKEAMRNSEATVDAAAKAMARFKLYTKHKDFKAFHFEQAIAFKKYLAEQKAQQSGEKLSKATLYATLTQLKRFFQWLAWQPDYKSRLQYSDAEYFNLSEKDTRIATTQREKKSPTLEQIKHVNMIGNCVNQDAHEHEVNTKFSKTFDTFFSPVGDDIRAIAVEWIKYLREEKQWGNDDPLFPATRVALCASMQFETDGLDRKHWSNATPIRTIFPKAFTDAGLPYFNPHSFRNTLVRLGEEICKTPEQFKAWSQSLGHEKVLTTFLSYGGVAYQRQGEIIRNLSKLAPKTQSDTNELIQTIIRTIRNIK